MSTPLHDREFLKALHKQNIRTLYARIIALNELEAPIEVIEGQVTGGSINVDGASAVRRTCSLTLVAAPGSQFTDYYWVTKTKFKVEIGLKNSINANYPDIIWFKQGMYLISSFSISRTTNNLTISIQGKDKMARLNGEMGGTLPAQYRFDAMDEIDMYGNITEVKIPIRQIITSALVLQGYENAHNVIINDLDEQGYELWDYKAKKSSGESYPMYYFYDEENSVANVTTNGDMKIGGVTLKNIPQKDLYNRIDNFDEATEFVEESKGYRVSKLEYGDTAGYHRTDLVYPTELTLNAGEPLTAMLDKIKNLLGAFEYFYDLDGRFVFQKQKTYTQGLFSPLREDGTVEPAAAISEYSFKFEDTEIITNLSNNPQINNIKNDFAIWGNRKSATGSDIPIHARYAVDKKPTEYTTLDYYTGYHMCYLEVIDSTKDSTGLIYDVITNGYKLRENQKDKENGKLLREYYYTTRETGGTKYYKDGDSYLLMPDEYYVRNKETKVFEQVHSVSSNLDQKEIYYLLTHPSALYTTENYDWRELIYLMARDYFQHNEEVDFLFQVKGKNPQFVTGKTGYEQYYTDIQGFWRQLYNPEGTEKDGFLQDGVYKYWHVNAVYYPEQLNFWIDFLEPNSEYLEKYSIAEIGDRLVVDNKSNVRALQLKSKPEVEFIIMPDEVENAGNTGSLAALAQMRVQADFAELFTISTRGTTAAEKADELINKHICENETIGITIIPLYFLEPNTKIYVKNEELGIDGDFIVSKFTIPLTYNGTMQLTTTKVLKYIK